MALSSGSSGLQFSPDEFGQYFTGRVFQARNIVQVVVVQALIQRLEDRLDFREVTNPASVRVEVATEVDRHFERVTVQAAAFVAVRDVRQAVGGFEGKLFENFHSGFSSVQVAIAAAMWAGGEFNSLS